MDLKYGTLEEKRAHCACLRASGPIRVDGRLDEEAWRVAPLSPPFVDLVSGAPAPLATRIACLWDDEAFYVGFHVEEPDVRATFSARDSFLWNENDVEMFIGGDDCYYELAVNALGTVYEAFFVWRDALRPGSRFDLPEYDPRCRDVDMLGGFQDASRFGRHPRGRRWAFLDWDFPGLRSAVHVDGVINDGAHADKGWTVELAFPWRGMKPLFAARTFPPGDGDVLRVGFSRLEAAGGRGRPRKAKAAWSLNPHGVRDLHIPECFSFVHFGGGRAGS